MTSAPLVPDLRSQPANGFVTHCRPVISNYGKGLKSGKLARVFTAALLLLKKKGTRYVESIAVGEAFSGRFNNLWGVTRLARLITWVQSLYYQNSQGQNP